MRALAVLLFATSVSAAEIPFTPPVYGPAAANQLSAAVASDGTDFLVVWLDQRAVPFETYATRVTRDGVVLDRTGIRIAARDVYQRRVVWTGTAYLIVWAEGNGRVMSARVSREGVVVQQPTLLVEDAQLPDVIRSGDLTIVGYLTGTTYPFEGRALFLDADGSVVARVTLTAPGTNIGAPRIGFNGTDLVAVWTDGGIIDNAIVLKAARFNAQGLIDASPRTVRAEGYNVDPVIASDGRDFVVVTRDYDTNVHRALALTSDLTAGASFELPTDVYWNPSLMWAGSHYVLVAGNGSDINAMRLDRDGQLIDAATTIEATLIAGSAPTPAAATNGADVFVAWNAPLTADSFLDGFDVYGGVFSNSTFERRSRSLLSVAATRQLHALVAASDRGLLTVWNDEPSGLFARRTDFDGRPVDATPLRLGSSIFSAVAFDGRDYVVAWSESFPARIGVRRIPVAGAIDAGTTSSFSTEYVSSVALASDGATTVLAWRNDDRLFASRVGDDGSLVDVVPVEIVSGLLGPAAISAAGGHGFLVTWTEGVEICCHGSSIPIAIHASRLTPGMTLLDAGGFVVADSEALEADPAVTWNGVEWLVVWHRNSGIENELRARRVGLDGRLLNGVATDPGVLIARDASLPSLTWDGVRYMVSWVDRMRPYEPLRLHVAWMPSVGVLINERIIGEGEAYALTGGPALAPIAPGRIAVAYTRIGREAVYGGVSRAFLNPVSFTRRRAVR